jgi:hypothetical protein
VLARNPQRKKKTSLSKLKTIKSAFVNWKKNLIEKKGSRENRRVIGAKKKAQCHLRGRKRRRLTPLCERQALVGYIQQAVTEGIRIEPAYGEAYISLRTYPHLAKSGNIVTDKRPDTVRVTPPTN